MNKSIHYSKVFTLISYFTLIAVMTFWVLLKGAQETRILALIFQPMLLLFPMKGLLDGKPYTYAWSSFLALYYFMIGVSDSAVEETRLYGLCVTSLSIVFFIASIIYARKAGKQLKPDAALNTEHAPSNALTDSQPTQSLERRQELPWTAMITGIFCLAPLGFVFSAWLFNGAYLVMLLFPFIFYVMAIGLGFVISFGIKVLSRGRYGFNAISFIKVLNYCAYASCIALISWALISQMAT